jgi:flagellar biosynthesis protein FliQ
MTLVLVPKIIASLLVLLFMLPWMMNKMTAYTEQLILNIPTYAK